MPLHIIKLFSNVKKNHWSNFINSNRLKNLNGNVDKLIIDFRECGFLEPFHIVALACLIEEYFVNGVEIEFANYSHNLELCDYLTNTSFFDYWKEGHDRSDYIPAYLSSTLNLWKLNPEMISVYTATAQEYFENNYLDSKSAEPLNIALAELFNNINDHSRSEIGGYCISQYYRNGKMKIAVCDFGEGIPNVVNRFLTNQELATLTDEQALIKAFIRKFSTKSAPHNKGFGLDNIKTIVQENNGSLKVISNSAVLEIVNDAISTYNIKSPFNGTHFEIILDTNAFNDKEESIDNIVSL